jgi:NitT/TauT family transport system permease protein
MRALGDRFGSALAPLAVAAGLLVLWQIAALVIRSSYLPPMTEILPMFGALLWSGDIYPDLASSLARLFVGLGIGSALGIPLGLLSGRSRAVENFITPILAAFYPVPKAALMPIVMLWFGAGDLSKVLVIALTVSLPLVYHAQEGARTVEEKLIWSAQAVGCSGFRRLRRVIRQSGLGNYLFTALDMGQYAMTYAVMLVIAVLGFLLDWIFETVRRRLAYWAPDRREADLAATS